MSLAIVGIQERLLKEKNSSPTKVKNRSVCFCSVNFPTRSEIESGIHAEAILLLRRESFLDTNRLCPAICEFSKIFVSKKLKMVGSPLQNLTLKYRMLKIYHDTTNSLIHDGSTSDMVEWYNVIQYDFMIPLMVQKSGDHHLGCIKNHVNNGPYLPYQLVIAGFLNHHPLPLPGWPLSTSNAPVVRCPCFVSISEGAHVGNPELVSS